MKTINVKTIVYFAKSNFAWKRNGKYDIDDRFICELEYKFKLKVKRIVIVEFYSDNTSLETEEYFY